MNPSERKKITDGADRRASSRPPRVRQFEHVGTSDAIGRCTREMANGRTAKDGFLGRGGRVIHPDSGEQLATEELVVRRAGHYFEQATRHDHPAIRVADVFAWLEKGPAVLAEPVKEDTEGAGTLSVGEE